MQPYSSKVHVTDQVIWESMHFSVNGSAAHVGDLSICASKLCHFTVCRVLWLCRDLHRNLQHCHKEQCQCFRKVNTLMARQLAFDLEVSIAPQCSQMIQGCILPLTLNFKVV